jgi:hypothetical protein
MHHHKMESKYLVVTTQDIKRHNKNVSNLAA